MLPHTYNDYLYRTSLARVAHGEASRATSSLLLERARASLERSRTQVSRPLSVEPVCFATIAPENPTTAPAQAAQAPDLMEIVSGRSFQGELVVLDGKHFVECTMTNCTLEYSGSPVVLESTQFAGCRFRFQGHAAMTMQLMECLGYGTEGTPESHDEPASTATSSRPN